MIQKYEVSDARVTTHRKDIKIPIPHGKGRFL
jgi:hypothetical protein